MLLGTFALSRIDPLVFIRGFHVFCSFYSIILEREEVAKLDLSSVSICKYNVTQCCTMPRLAIADKKERKKEEC